MKREKRLLLPELYSFMYNKKNLNHIKKCENKDFCNIEENKILEFDQHQKSNKTPFIIYADLECLIKKIDESKDNPENVSNAKLGEHISSGFSMTAISSFKDIENNHDVYRCKDCLT